MGRNKHRLHIALYARPGLPNSYHYALITSSKDRSSDIVMYHATNARRSTQGLPTQRWRHEKFSLNTVVNEPRLLVLITVAKVIVSSEELTEVLRTVPIYQPEDGEQFQNFSCAGWVKIALQRLFEEKAIANDGGTADWAHIDQEALKFVGEQKAQGQVDDNGWVGYKEIPCLDLLHKQ